MVDIKRKIEIFKNRGNVLRIRMLGKDTYETRIMKALVINASGNIQIHNMLASHKLMGFAYQINEVWREINPESRLTYENHPCYIYVGNCMMPIKFEAKAFNPIKTDLVKRKTINEDGEEDEQEAQAGHKLKSSGYYFIEPINFDRILNAKLIGELAVKESGIPTPIKWGLIFIVIGVAIYLMAKTFFGVDLLAMT